MKFSQNFERAADETRCFANRARDLIQEAPLALVLNIPRMVWRVA